MRKIIKIFLLSIGLLLFFSPVWSQNNGQEGNETVVIHQMINVDDNIISPTDYISGNLLSGNKSSKSKGGKGGKGGCGDDHDDGGCGDDHDDGGCGDDHDDGGCGDDHDDGGCGGGNDDGGCQKLGHLAIVSLIGSDNQAYVDQRGNGNSTTWIQEGNNNSFDLSQRGRQNVHEGSLSGEDNLIKILQRGKGNYIRQELVGSDMDLEIVQKGRNHEFIQIETANNSPAYKVHQQGNHGMKIIVEHSQF